MLLINFVGIHPQAGLAEHGDADADTPIATRPNPEPYPVVASRKGLQVQMTDDALALGIHHAALNLDLGQLIEPARTASSVMWRRGEIEYSFNANYLAQLDAGIKPLSDQGVLLSLIVLNYLSQDEAKRLVLGHPRYSLDCPNRMSAFNVQTEVGREWLSASFEFLAERWSRPDAKYGRVWNWILGNEVNSHWFWSNRGRVDWKTFADEYLVSLRLAHAALRRSSTHAKLFVPLDHHWNIAYPGGAADQCFAARPFLEYLATKSREPPLIDWHVAFHPYPENLFEPRSWLDKSATPDWRDTPRITFKNLSALSEFLREDHMLTKEGPRHVILSEQGFHTPDGPEGERIQAAAYCYAWMRVAATPGIDAFILHRHVDHANEGGLRLGLWTRKPESVAEPDQPKFLYEVFKAANTDRAEEAFQFARPLIGITEWNRRGSLRDPTSSELTD